MDINQYIDIFQTKLLEIVYVLRVYLCILMDNFGLLQYSFPSRVNGNNVKDLSITSNSLYKNIDSLLYSNHGIELNYGKYQTKGVHLRLSGDVKEVCIILGTLNPGFITNVARNLPDIQFHVYSSNDNMKEFITRRNYENITTYDCSEFNPKIKYDRILVGPHIVTNNIIEYVSTFKKCLNPKGILIYQSICNFPKDKNMNYLVRNTLTFNKFFTNKDENKSEYIIPSIERFMLHMSNIAYIIPMWLYEADINLLLSTFNKTSEEYDFLFRASRLLKLYGHKYYLGTFEYINKG